MTTLGSLHAITELFRYLFERRKKEGNSSQNKDFLFGNSSEKHC